MTLVKIINFLKHMQSSDLKTMNKQYKVNNAFFILNFRKVKRKAKLYI